MNESTYCKFCGAYIPTDQEKCLACGFPTEIQPLVDSEFESMRSHAGWKPYCDVSELQEKPDIDLWVRFRETIYAEMERRKNDLS